MRECLEIEDAAAAAVLNRPRLHALLAALIARECTTTALVGLTGMSYSLLSHHLKRLQALGWVVVAGYAPRAGRAAALYRATARSYFIPARWCQALPGDRLARDLRAALDSTCAPEGVLLFNEDGPRLRLVHPQARRDTTELWLRLRLSAPAARQFNEELQALFERWRAQQSPTGRAYLLHGACAREPAA
jgi:DNA-binding transcriptional ArsR family regulator